MGTLTYSYDATGRGTGVGGSFARTRLPLPSGSSTYNAANQLTQRDGTTFTYDLNGNLTTDGVRTLAWNAANQLAAIGGTTSGAFQYDGFGRRTRKVDNGASSDALHDGDMVVQELSGGVPTAQFLNGLSIDEVLTRTDANGRRTLLADVLGSTIALANDAGSLTTQYTYEPFGGGMATGEMYGNSSGFTGREVDNTGMLHYRARYYEPRLQRFVSEDPIEFGGGDPNLYSYVGNAPTDWTDPDGTHPIAAVVIAAVRVGAVALGRTAGIRAISGATVAAGAVTGAATDAGLQLILNGGFDCFDWGSVGVSGGLGAIGGGLGGARRFGTEFSHTIPRRYFNPRSRSYQPWLPGWLDNSLNGSWVSPARHYRHDPFRYPSGWRDFGDRLHPGLRAVDGTPDWMKGGAVGGLAGRGKG